MSKIIVLDELTASQIAAGEVIERPASVVKELVENSIDAGATSVSVEIRAGGIKYIRVTDNGCGFEADDAVIAFDKHATSKIRCGGDLENITTLGFRGEALASIAAVSDVELLSKTKEAETGVYVHIRGCDVIETGERGAANGSVITVRDIFYNTPARYKFLKKDGTEASYAADILQKLAIANPGISFRLTSNGSDVFRTPGDGDLRTVIFSIFGRSVAGSVLPVKYELDGCRITGLAGVRDAVFSNRSRQLLYVNGRCVRSKAVTSAIDEAYKTVTMKNKFPFVVLMLELPVSRVDVNVHPTKAEVRFSDESGVCRLVYNGLKNALLYDNREDRQAPISSPARETAPAPISETARKPAPAPVPAAAATDESARKPAPAAATAPIPVPIPAMPIPMPTPAAAHASVFDTAHEDHNLPEIRSAESDACEDEPGKPVLYNSSSVYTDSEIIGQIFDTYIILQYGNEMVLIDQHAAHERIKYEEIKELIESPCEAVSPMLVPITMELTPSEYIAFNNNIEFFRSMGFETDCFGGNAIIIRAVPAVLAGSCIEDVILSGLRGKKSTGYTDEEIYTMACKAAVKANKRLSRAEIEELLKKLAKLENSGTCPHGRPITVSITEHELERRFKRCL